MECRGGWWYGVGTQRHAWKLVVWTGVLTGDTMHELAGGVGENSDAINLRQQHTGLAKGVSDSRGQRTNIILNHTL